MQKKQVGFILGNHRKDEIKTSATERTCCVIKCLILAACVSGFSYQLLQFLSHFYKYPTVLEIEIKEPDHFIEPAMTVCNLNPVKRSEFCHRFPEKCQYVTNLMSFCHLRPHYCERADMSNFMIAKEPSIDFDEDDDKRKMLDQLIDTNPDLFILLNQHSNFREDYIGPFFINSALPCYILHSRAFNNMEPNNIKFLKHLRNSRMMQATSISKSFINLNESETYNHLAMPSAVLAIHSPFEIVDPTSDGLVLEPGKNYKIHIRLEENHFLPHPYQTNCHDYELQWINNNKTGPRSKQVCISSCWANYDLACFNCSKPLLKHKLEKSCTAFVPAHCDTALENDQLKFCLSQCKTECNQRKYVYRLQEQPYEKLPSNIYGRNLIQVEVVIDEPQILTYIHKPQYEAVELFSYIGGFLGCWLGFSVWSSCTCVLGFTRRFTSKESAESKQFNSPIISPEIHSYFGVDLNSPQ